MAHVVARDLSPGVVPQVTGWVPHVQQVAPATGLPLRAVDGPLTAITKRQ